MSTCINSSSYNYNNRSIMATSPRTWRPFSFLDQNSKYVLILLNQPVQDKDLLVRLWNKAVYRATVDGGTSVWHKIINNTVQSLNHEIPDLITGDFDSANLDNVEYFKSQGSEVAETLDQDKTDFTKCLEEISKRLKNVPIAAGAGNVRPAESSSRLLYAFVENSGRLDQIMANLQTLYLAPETLGDVYLVSSECLTWLLPPGHHDIHLPTTQLEGLHCGLIPLSGTTIISTKGLKWNLEAGELAFGSLVSTSNAFISTCVSITTNKQLLFTMDIIKNI